MAQSTPMLPVEAAGLVKSYAGRRVVDGIDLSVHSGSVLGLLGPNGAGKTTVIRMLATLLEPDGGTAAVFGHDVRREPDAVRRRISLTGQFSAIDDDLTGVENLTIQARLLGLSRRDAARRTTELLDVFDLVDAGRRQVRSYSGGMKRRLDVAASVVSTPDLLFLDEPTTGLDPRSRNQVWEVVRDLVAQGTTVLLTTQYLEEADQLADRIAVIDRGSIVADGSPGALKSSAGSGVLRLRLSRPAQRDLARRTLAEALGAAVTVEPDPAVLTARVPGGTATSLVAHGVGRVVDAGVEVETFALGQPSLDEVFLALTGHLADDTATDAPDEGSAA